MNKKNRYNRIKKNEIVYYIKSNPYTCYIKSELVKEGSQNPCNTIKLESGIYIEFQHLFKRKDLEKLKKIKRKTLLLMKVDVLNRLNCLRKKKIVLQRRLTLIKKQL